MGLPSAHSPTEGPEIRNWQSPILLESPPDAHLCEAALTLPGTREPPSVAPPGGPPKTSTSGPTTSGKGKAPPRGRTAGGRAEWTLVSSPHREDDPGKNRHDFWVGKRSRGHMAAKGLPASGRRSEETKAEIVQEAGDTLVTKK